MSSMDGTAATASTGTVTSITGIGRHTASVTMIVTTVVPPAIAAGTTTTATR
jgi:hypothetical protein